MVAGDHLAELVLGVGVGVGVVPGDGPVDGDFGPDQQAHLVGHPDHFFVVGVVRQAHEIAAHLPGPAERGTGVSGAERTACSFNRTLVVDGDALAEDFLSVEQDLAALRGDGLEADPVADAVCHGGHDDFVELRVLGTPQPDAGLAGQGDAERGQAVAVALRRGAQTQFGDLYADRLRGIAPVHPDPAFDGLAVGGEAHAVIPDEGLGDFEQLHAAGDAAVVPPVGVDGGDTVLVAFVVHLDDQGVLSGTELLRDFEVEGGEPAGMLPDERPVEGGDGLVIGSVEMDEVAVSRLGLRIEQAAVPDGTFIIIEFFALGVPVSGDLQGPGGIEVVLDQPRGVGIEMPVREEGVLGAHRLHPVVVVAVLIGIDDGAPGPVQGLPGASSGMLDGRGGRGAERQQHRQGDAAEKGFI